MGAARCGRLTLTALQFSVSRPANANQDGSWQEAPAEKPARSTSR